MSSRLNFYSFQTDSNNFKSKSRVPPYLSKYQQIFKEMLQNQGINLNTKENYFTYQNTQPSTNRKTYNSIISNSFSTTPVNEELSKTKLDFFLGDNKYNKEPKINYLKNADSLKNSNKKLKYNYGYSKNYSRYIKESAINHFKDYIRDVKNKRPVTNFKQEMYNIKKEMLNKNDMNKKKLFEKHTVSSSNEFVEKLHKNFPEYSSMKKYSGNSFIKNDSNSKNKFNNLKNKIEKM